VRLDDGARALRLLVARSGGSDQALDLLLAQHSLALNLGRPAEALAITRQIQRLSPAGRVQLRLQVLDAAFADGDTAAGAAAALDLARTARSAGLPNAGADACAVAQWQLARADTAGARATLELLREDGPEEPGPVTAPPSLCARLIEASLAVAGRRKDARARLEHIDSLVLTSAAVGDAAAYAPLVLARLYHKLGESERALAAVRRRPYMAAVWPRYLATELREEGDLARHRGDTAGALAAYRRYLALRARPEPSVQPAVTAVREQVAALERAPSASP
jgi:tetratricopeptide (TPR) repeat protein